jgi:hypothetical protein
MHSNLAKLKKTLVEAGNIHLVQSCYVDFLEGKQNIHLTALKVKQ